LRTSAGLPNVSICMTFIFMIFGLGLDFARRRRPQTIPLQ
jgi:hypothetical protein